MYVFGSFFVDEKERYDPIGFRDGIITGLDKCSNDFEAISRFLDQAGNKLDYRRYGECLFDILIAGGTLGKFSPIIMISNNSTLIFTCKSHHCYFIN